MTAVTAFWVILAGADGRTETFAIQLGIAVPHTLTVFLSYCARRGSSFALWQNWPDLLSAEVFQSLSLIAASR